MKIAHQKELIEKSYQVCAGFWG